LGHSQDVWALTFWGPHDGDFMFHCHNLVHEGTLAPKNMVSFCSSCHSLLIFFLSFKTTT
jgi:hypothetical protein